MASRPRGPGQAAGTRGSARTLRGQSQGLGALGGLHFDSLRRRLISEINIEKRVSLAPAARGSGSQLWEAVRGRV